MKIAVVLDENTKVMLLVVNYFQSGMVEYIYIYFYTANSALCGKSVLI